MIEVRKPNDVPIDNFQRVMNSINPEAFKGIVRQNKNRPNDRYVAIWDNRVARKPTPPEMIAVSDALTNRLNQRETRYSDARSKIVNNADTIKAAMTGVADARAALDALIPIDESSAAAAINSLAQRQAAIFFLESNILRALVAVADNRDIPDEIMDEFL